MSAPRIAGDGARPCTACSLCSASLSTTRVGCDSALAYGGFCSACAPGKYSKFLGEGREECASCAAGTYQSLATRGVDATACALCPSFSDSLPRYLHVSNMQCTKQRWNHPAESGDRYELDPADPAGKYPVYRKKYNGQELSSLSLADGVWTLQMMIVLSGSLVADFAYAIATDSMTPPGHDGTGWVEQCNGKWRDSVLSVRADFTESRALLLRSVSAVGSVDVSACQCQGQFERAAAASSSASSVCVCGRGRVLNLATNACTPSPANFYQPHERATTALR